MFSLLAHSPDTHSLKEVRLFWIPFQSRAPTPKKKQCSPGVWRRRDARCMAKKKRREKGEQGRKIKPSRPRPSQDTPIQDHAPKTTPQGSPSQDTASSDHAHPETGPVQATPSQATPLPPASSHQTLPPNPQSALSPHDHRLPK